MKQVLTITTIAAIFAFNFANAQQASFSFGKSKMVEQLTSAGWDFNNMASIKNFIYVKNTVKQQENFTVLSTPYLNLNANDAVALNYRVADDVQVAVYSQDAQGKLTRIMQLSPKASSVKVVVPQGGKQRIIVRVEKSGSVPANMVINSISFNNYTMASNNSVLFNGMSIKGMQDTPDILMPEDAPASNSTDNSSTSALAVKE